MLAFVVIVGVLLALVPCSANRNGWTGLGKSSMELIDEERMMELDEVMTLLQSVAHQLANLRGVIHNLKVHNQMIYKQLHKIHQEKCHRGPKRDLTYSAYQNYEADSVGAEKEGEETEVTVSAPAASSSSSCLPGFHQNPDTLKCYRVFHDQRVSWRLARDRCKSSGAELLSIQSAREQSFINEILRKKNTGKCDYWTGLTSARKTTAGYQLYPQSLQSSGASGGAGGRRTSGGGDTRPIWYWSGDGTSLGRYTNWNDNEPNNINGDGGGSGGGGAGDVCVQMLWIFDWKWNDAICTESSACFICQTPPPPPAKKISFRRQ